MVVLNQKLNEIYSPLFIPPNPSDCGLSCGMLLSCLKPKKAPAVMYSGPPIFDISKLNELKEKYGNCKASPKTVANLLADGRIIAVMRGNSEHGPRALGNRSILADPRNKNMKDRINKEIKFREWFRPFAPVVLEGRVSDFFEFDKTSEYMSFNPKVVSNWREKLPAITHVDGSARIQTVREESNKFIHDILKAFERIAGVPILLNTSFNIKGKPISTTIEDAIMAVCDSGIDFLLIENYLFSCEEIRNSQIIMETKISANT